MNQQDLPSTPLACVPGAIPAAERTAHFARLHHLFDSQVQERVDVTDGFAWRFESDAFDELATFVSLERLCCPFLHFRIDVHPDDGRVWLTNHGPPGARSFLEAEFAPAGAVTREAE
jgi:hypothetical protein